MKKLLIGLVVGGFAAALIITTIVLSVVLTRKGDPEVISYSGVSGTFLVFKGKTVDGVDEFYNIPYVPKPDRFKPSVYPDTISDYMEKLKSVMYNTKRNSMEFNAQDSEDVVCTQGFRLIDKTTTEDCLVLTVRTPSDRDTSPRKLPIIVWYHGGGLTVGWNEQTGYSPKGVFAKSLNVVVVNVNYRLGLLGYNVLESDNYNNGLIDQLNALKWVHMFGSAFGGDTNDITIFGESAGATSVLAMNFALIPDPDEEGISTPTFHRVVALSPAGGINEDVGTARTIQRASWLLESGCSEADDYIPCMEKLPADTFTLNVDTVHGAYPGYGYFDFPERDDHPLPNVQPGGLAGG